MKNKTLVICLVSLFLLGAIAKPSKRINSKKIFPSAKVNTGMKRKYSRYSKKRQEKVWIEPALRNPELNALKLSPEDHVLSN